MKPVKTVYSEININASAEQVWKNLMEFDAYPKWNPFILQIGTDKLNEKDGQKKIKNNGVGEIKNNGIGEIKVGKTITAKIQPPGRGAMVFNPMVLEFEPNKKFTWLGKLWIKGLFDGEHHFEIKENGDGSITFKQFEHFNGILVPLLRKMLDENTLEGFNQMNKALKEICEKGSCN